MIDKHAANCQWATSTLLLEPPLWIEAATRPWACVRDAAPATLDSTDICQTCGRWERLVESWAEARLRMTVVRRSLSL